MAADTVTVTVLRGGWWLPGRALEHGETLELDAATAEGLALRGIVRLQGPVQRVAPNAGTPTDAAPVKARKSRKETPQ
jgi:hypothetical protein